MSYPIRNRPKHEASTLPGKAAAIIVAVFLCHLEEIAYLCTVELQDEFTAKMHSEFTVDAETDRKHRAGCVWRLLGFDATREDIEHWASEYGITYDKCMEYKSFWKNLHDNSKK